MEAAIKSFDALYMTLLVNLSNIEVNNSFSQLGTATPHLLSLCANTAEPHFCHKTAFTSHKPVFLARQGHFCTFGEYCKCRCE